MIEKLNVGDLIKDNDPRMQNRTLTIGRQAAPLWARAGAF